MNTTQNIVYIILKLI